MKEALSHELNTSVVRVNLLEWMEFEPGKTVLLAGETADVIVDFLRDRGLAVTLKKEDDSDYTQYYDYVIHIEDPLFFRDDLDDTKIAEMASHIKGGGTLIIAVSNRLGMKYLNGGISAEDQQPYEGIASQTQVTKQELDGWLKECGFSTVKYYYPVPDHVFPTQIFSDDFLPGLGDLRGNTPGYWEGGLMAGSEEALGYQACDNKLFPQLANSYLIIAER